MDFIEYILRSITNLKIISIIGLAKNVSKTTTLNYIINSLTESHRLGLTSIGRDGEAYDIITDLPKPQIYVKKGAFFATAEDVMKNREIEVNVIKHTSFNTPLGSIKIYQAISEGFVELAGPSMNVQLLSICNELEALNCDIILIDGAFDRKAYATPLISDGVILSTGASVSEDIKEVINETTHLVNLLTLPKIKNVKVTKLIKTIYQKARVGIIFNNHEIKILNLKTLLGSEKLVIENLNKSVKYLVIKGAVTSKLINLILNKRKTLNNFTIVAEDSTKLFVNRKTFNNFIKMGNSIKILYPINLLAVTINPISPLGYGFDKFEFLSKLKSKIHIPVFDLGSE